MCVALISNWDTRARRVGCVNQYVVGNGSMVVVSDIVVGAHMALSSLHLLTIVMSDVGDTFCVLVSVDVVSS